VSTSRIIVLRNASIVIPALNVMSTNAPVVKCAKIGGSKGMMILVSTRLDAGGK